MEITEEKSLTNLLKGYNMLLYFSGSMVMNEPTAECIDDFWVTGIMKALPVSSKNPRFLKALSVLRDSCSDKNLCRLMLVKDYEILFHFTGTARPIESEWTEESSFSHINGFGSVKAFYESYGWKSNHDGLIPDDHLGIELLFLTLLIDKYVSLDDRACRKEMSREIRRFIRDHLLNWIPQWNKRVQENAHTLCYKGIGTLIHAVAEDLDAIFTVTDRSGF